jgi:hypothetical protein
MDSFFDSTVIVKSIEYEYIKEQLRKKCFNSINFCEGKILISFIVKDEIQRTIIKRKEIYECVLRKIRDPSYEINHENTVFLNKEEIIFAQSLYLKLKEKDVTKLKKEFDSEIDFLNVEISLFLKNKLNEIAIKKSDLDSFVVSIIYEFIEDFPDCRVLTSAIQMQQDRNKFLFVTADKHFYPGTYKSIEEEPRLEKYKFPKLKNLLFES